MKEYYVLREIKKLNEKGYSIEFCECYNSVDIKVYGHNRNIEKTVYLSGYGYYSENDYIYALQEIMVEIGLEEERDKKIKLKQWEYDLIRTNDMSHNRTFVSFNTYRSMKKIGHFAGIKDVSMTLKEILENCEVVE
jgi:hypothetical protein